VLEPPLPFTFAIFAKIPILGSLLFVLAATASKEYSTQSKTVFDAAWKWIQRRVSHLSQLIRSMEKKANERRQETGLSVCLPGHWSLILEKEELRLPATSGMRSESTIGFSGRSSKRRKTQWTTIKSWNEKSRGRRCSRILCSSQNDVIIH
jgi:hypothetical protein